MNFNQVFTESGKKGKHPIKKTGNYIVVERLPDIGSHEKYQIEGDTTIYSRGDVGPTIDSKLENILGRMYPLRSKLWQPLDEVKQK